jgi:type IX secretion system PorP/SprF family membrane protein
MQNQIRLVTQLLMLLAATLAATEARAQLNPLAGIYFDNEYLANPAMAGVNQGLNLNLGYRQQWSAFSGSPQTQAVTADYGTGKKVGVGLSIYNDEAGLIKRTRAMGTYAYHLPINKNQNLHFGLSFGLMDQRISNETVKGDLDDNSISTFNDSETYMDGDFGLAYTRSKLTIQATIPNLKGSLKRDDLNRVGDRSSFFSAISYKFYFPKAVNGLEIEPKLVYRTVKGYDHIVDLAANFAIANRSISLMTIYHSTQSSTFGLGVAIKKLGSVSSNYTTSTSSVSQYGNANFQIALRLNLMQKDSSK